MADYYMACSDEAGRWLFGDVVVGGNRYKTIRNAINPDRFQYNEAIREKIRKKLGLNDAFVIGHIGRFTEVKNHSFLIDILYELRIRGVDAYLLLVGDGDEKSRIQKKAKGLNVYNFVMFLGGRTDTEKLYQAMDLFVFPSLWEGLGIAAIEAQATGLRCIVSDGVPDIVDIGSNLVTRISLKKDVKIWTDEILKLKSKEYERCSQIEAIRAAGFDVKVNADKMEHFYRRAYELASYPHVKDTQKRNAQRYYIRLDDASEHMKEENWIRMKELLDYHEIKPIYGIIPDNKDPELLQYQRVDKFWKKMRLWQEEGWIPAQHGYQHVFVSKDGGINPVNYKSEFAGISIAEQKEKIRLGYTILKESGINPKIFFAPAHTFDENTLKALFEETDIRTISDTVAGDVYYKEHFYFIPQQSGHVRKLPFKTVTFCYHPNIMMDKDFEELDAFIRKNKEKFQGVGLQIRKRKYDIRDELLKNIYFGIKTIRRVGRNPKSFIGSKDR